MANYAHNMLYLTWGGSIGSAVGAPEVWQCGVHFAADNRGSVGWEPAFDMEPLWTALSTAHKSSSAPLSSGCIMKWVKLAHIAPNGEYDQDPRLYTAGTPAAGNSAPASGCAPQLAMCITLWSGSNLGKGNFGRFYVPWPVATVANSTGKITNAQQYGDTWMAAIGGCLTPLANSTFGPIELIIPHQGTDPAKAVNYFKCGDVVDTQRRRRNRIQETYYQALFVHGRDAGLPDPADDQLADA